MTQDHVYTSSGCPPESASRLAPVSHLLAAGEPAAALAAVPSGSDPWLANARGVCLLRLGRHSQAVDALRPLVFDSTGLSLSPDAHPVFEANYATALLLSGNTDGFQSILSGARGRSHPAVARLTDAVRRWRAGLTWGEWVGSLVGRSPRPLVLDFPPGSL